MGGQAYTLAMYRVKAGREGEFVAAWDELARTFSALPEPPLWGTLIRHRADRALFYSFGPWHSPEHVRAMRESPAAGAAFARLRELCEELTPGDFEAVTHVDVRGAGSAPAKYRDELPQLGGGLFLTDGGIETTLIFHDGLELPDFAAFHLLKTEEGRAALHRYFRSYAEVARKYGAGLILESATWRASADWGARLGYTPEELAEANRKAVGLLEAVRGEYEAERTPVVISGCIGPRGDGYAPGAVMSEREAEEYHRTQVEAFADSAADMVCAITMNYAEEAVGVAQAAGSVGMPVAVSFTVETDGRLPTGMTLGEAVALVDESTGGYPAYYMINCAHPTHFEHVLDGGAEWIDRVRGLRANASRKSHAELNDSPDLDTGDPAELGAQYAALKGRLPGLNVMGGCCGTDHRHVEKIAEACSPLFRVRG